LTKVSLIVQRTKKIANPTISSTEAIKMNDTQKQFEDGIKKGLEANAKVMEINAKYASEYTARTNQFWTNLIDAGVKNAEELTQSKSLTEAYEKQTQFAQDVKAGFESSHQENIKAFELAKEEYEAITAGLYPAAVKAAKKAAK
jgi:hypothetical protein